MRRNLSMNNVESINFLHGGNWQMFMNYQKFAGSLRHNFEGKWFIAKK